MYFKYSRNKESKSKGLEAGSTMAALSMRKLDWLSYCGAKGPMSQSISRDKHFCHFGIIKGFIHQANLAIRNI